MSSRFIRSRPPAAANRRLSAIAARVVTLVWNASPRALRKSFGGMGGVPVIKAERSIKDTLEHGLNLPPFRNRKAPVSPDARRQPSRVKQGQMLETDTVPKIRKVLFDHPQYTDHDAIIETARHGKEHPFWSMHPEYQHLADDLRWGHHLATGGSHTANLPRPASKYPERTDQEWDHRKEHQYLSWLHDLEQSHMFQNLDRTPTGFSSMAMTPHEKELFEWHEKGRRGKRPGSVLSTPVTEHPAAGKLLGHHDHATGIGSIVKHNGNGVYQRFNEENGGAFEAQEHHLPTSQLHPLTSSNMAYLGVSHLADPAIEKINSETQEANSAKKVAQLAKMSKLQEHPSVGDFVIRHHPTSGTFGISQHRGQGQYQDMIHRAGMTKPPWWSEPEHVNKEHLFTFHPDNIRVAGLEDKVPLAQSIKKAMGSEMACQSCGAVGEMDEDGTCNTCGQAYGSPEEDQPAA